MKGLILIISLFATCLTFGQQFRLDSLINYRSPGNIDIHTYSFLSDRDFTVYDRIIKDGSMTGSWTNIYRDSLKITSSGELSNGERVIKEFQYDDLRRFSSVMVKGPGPYSLKVTQTYWKESKLPSMEERVSFNKRDTTTYRITFYTYDDQLRERSKSYYNKDESGKITKDSSLTDYFGDSLAVTNYTWFYKDDDWDRYTFRTRIYPEVHFGDTVLTSNILYKKNEEKNIQDSQYLKKITWGKGALNDFGFINYENDGIHGIYFKYTLTDHGYNLEQYACNSGKGFEWWRDDIQNQFHLATTLYVSLNQYGQPVRKEEIYAATGALKWRAEYYYQEGGVEVKNISTLFPTSACKIINELNPDFLYYDVSGKSVSSFSGSAYLIEKTPDSTNRVLFIEK